jgi:hypothetical protein
MIPVDSSLIKAIGYDKEKGELIVQFKKGGEKYRYQDVPENVWEQFKAAESTGKFFLANIKGAFGYTKVEGA